ncbi:MAG: TIGR04255 family protein [Gammaproteobacteria bacterium]|nr:TIGR04255 family protein [Gammaproteobacteria bacterium]
MVWQLDNPEHLVYSRNPLVATIVEIKYHPILKIGSGKGVAEFQDCIRTSFPQYAEVATQVVNLINNVPGQNAVEMREEKQYRFIKEGGATALTLGDSNVILENRKHHSHEDTLRDMELVVKALLEVYKPVKPTRLGTRYINKVSRSAIASELNETVQWEDLVCDDFLRIPCHIAETDGAAFAMEMNSQMLQGGAMTLRYGMKLDNNQARSEFRFDIDRYMEGDYNVEDTCSLLDIFTKDIYALFSKMAGPALIRWMEPTQK